MTFRPNAVTTRDLRPQGSPKIPAGTRVQASRRVPAKRAEEPFTIPFTIPVRTEPDGGLIYVEREAVRFDDDHEKSAVDESEQVNHWSLGEIPPEPDAGTLVADRDGTAWIRMGDTAWQRAGMVRVFGGFSWMTLLAERGPLVRLVPAPPEDHVKVDVDAVLRVNDVLRAELARYRAAE